MEKGTVINVTNDKLTVAFKRGASCGSCKACSESENQDEMEIQAFNDCEAKLGDTVAVVIETEFMLKATAIMYGIPLITMFVGFLLGNLISPLVSFITGLVFLGLTYYVIKLNDSKFQNRNFIAKAVEIVTE